MEIFLAPATFKAQATISIAALIKRRCQQAFRQYRPHACSVHTGWGIKWKPSVKQTSYLAPRPQVITLSLWITTHACLQPLTRKWGLQRTTVHKHYTIRVSRSGCKVLPWREATTSHVSVKEHGATAGDTSFLGVLVRFFWITCHTGTQMAALLTG